MGRYVPEKILKNIDFEKTMDTSDEWIRSRTGIEERHIAAEDENTSHMAIQAAKKAIEDAGITPDQIGLIIVATVTPDRPFPSVACQLRSIGHTMCSNGCFCSMCRIYVWTCYSEAIC